MGKHQEDNLRSALATAGIGVWEWEPATDGLSRDAAFDRLFGLDPQQPVDWAMLRTMVDAEDLSRLAGAANAERFEQEVRIRRRDGTERWLAVRGAKVDRNGPPGRLAGIAYDITEKRRAEASLQRSRLITEAANRAKSQLFTTLEREVRTPVSAILGGLDFMLGIDLPEEQRDCLEITRQAAVSMRRTIDDLIELDRLQAGEINLGENYFNLARCVERSLESMVEAAEQKGLGLKWQLDRRLPEVVVGDPQRLQQVLSRLLEIAISLAESGDLELMLAPADGTTDDRPGAAFTINIPGGCTAQLLGRRAAEPLRRVNDVPSMQPGAGGLGLAISRGLLALMGSELEIRGDEGSASFSFSVRFERSVAGERRQRAPRILLAEDDPIIRELLEISLKKKNWRTVAAENGEKALAEWRKGGFDLLLIDVQMPEIDGLEVARIIREQERSTGSHVPIVAITAHARQEDRSSCLAAGMDDYLSKPIRMGDLYQVIMRQLNQHGSKH